MALEHIRPFPSQGRVTARLPCERAYFASAPLVFDKCTGIGARLLKVIPIKKVKDPRADIISVANLYKHGPSRATGYLEPKIFLLLVQ